MGAGAKPFVPFRNSALTRLLQESLGGNCKTSLLLCVSPALADASETRGTLQFGSRAMRVRQEAIINARANYEEARPLGTPPPQPQTPWDPPSTRRHARPSNKPDALMGPPPLHLSARGTPMRLRPTLEAA